MSNILVQGSILVIKPVAYISMHIISILSVYVAHINDLYCMTIF